ncbi:hypothetical protein ACOJR9_16645 [Alteromonas sp. A081]|uniref:hypothetical protein n=1 Tax=Alteromonas sp. A081 TaxID=3410269 RepID=UPI003B9802E6
MSVICTVDSSQYWQQLCEKTSNKVVNHYYEINEGITESAFTRNVISLDEIKVLISEQSEVVVVVPPPFVVLESLSSYEFNKLVSDLTTKLNDLYSLYKKNKKTLTLVPLSAFCSNYPKAATTFNWLESVIDTPQVTSSIESVICHSLYNQSNELIRVYKKIQSCFVLKEADSLFYPDMDKISQLLIQQRIEQQELIAENVKVLEQNHLLLEKIEEKEIRLTSLQKKHAEDISSITKKQEKETKELESKYQRDSKLVNEKHSQDTSRLNDKCNSLSSELHTLSEQLHTVQKEFTNTEEEFSAFVQSSRKEATSLEKIKNREIKQLEVKLEQKLLVEQRLRAELAELRAIKSSKLWKISSKVEKLSSVVDKQGTKRKKLSQDMSLLYTSDLFDADWYLETYPDVLKKDFDPAEHYLLHGAKEGRKPSPQFDGKWYLQANPDVAKAGSNPLIHYLKFGRDERRPLSPIMITHNKK